MHEAAFCPSWWIIWGLIVFEFHSQVSGSAERFFNWQLILSKIRTFLFMFIVLSSSLGLFWVSRVFSFSDWWCFWLSCLFSQLFSSLITGAQVRPAVFPLWFQSNSEPPESDKPVISVFLEFPVCDRLLLDLTAWFVCLWLKLGELYDARCRTDNWCKPWVSACTRVRTASQHDAIICVCL